MHSHTHIQTHMYMYILNPRNHLPPLSPNKKIPSPLFTTNTPTHENPNVAQSKMILHDTYTYVYLEPKKPPLPLLKTKTHISREHA